MQKVESKLTRAVCVDPWHYLRRALASSRAVVQEIDLTSGGSQREKIVKREGRCKVKLVRRVESKTGES